VPHRLLLTLARFVWPTPRTRDPVTALSPSRSPDGRWPVRKRDVNYRKIIITRLRQSGGGTCRYGYDVIGRRNRRRLMAYDEQQQRQMMSGP